MPAPVSSIPAARTYVHDAAATALPDVLVYYDAPATRNLPDDNVCVGRVEQTFDAAAMTGSGGAGWLTELYVIDLTVMSFSASDDDTVAFTKCASIASALVEVVRNDPSLGGAVLVAKPISVSYDGGWDQERAGRISTALVRVQCRAQL